jgi:hypothetical protein
LPFDLLYRFNIDGGYSGLRYRGGPLPKRAKHIHDERGGITPLLLRRKCFVDADGARHNELVQLAELGWLALVGEPFGPERDHVRGLFPGLPQFIKLLLGWISGELGQCFLAPVRGTRGGTF